MSRVAIVGSRDYPDLDQVRRYVATLLPGDTVISGGARGVDTAAVEAATRRDDLDFEVYPAEWERYGKSAGYRRNWDIVNRADRVVAFHDGKSSGTAHTIKIARQQGKDVLINPKTEDSG